MTCSDGDLPGFGRGAAHPRSYGTFPRKLRVYALERGLLSLARALESMTGQPARVLGVADRGVMRPGAFADVVVFDPRRLRDTATYERPHALAEGMVHVFVNGVAAISAGEVTGQRAGRVLRRDRN